MSAGRVWNSEDFRAAPPPLGGTLFRCGLCGARFSHGDRSCPACALAPGCHLVRCPSCGYQFPRESALDTLQHRLRHWVGRLRARPGFRKPSGERP